jgi:lipid-A-disaccharide synthase
MFTKFNDRDLHPEFIQDDVTVENLLKAYNEYDRGKFLTDSKALRGYLQHGSSKTVASIIEGKSRIL